VTGEAASLLGSDRSTLGAETVLVVEDEDAVRKLVTRMLVAAGYIVVSAANGDEALALGARYERRIDLLLTDVVMPQMSGRRLAERFGELRPGLSVLYMSGYTDHALENHGVRRAVSSTSPSSVELVRKCESSLVDPSAPRSKRRRWR
jgi:CheY-like chemotaxis protein